MNQEILIGMFVAVEGAHAYSAFLPSVFTIKTFVKENDGKHAIREGELLATVWLGALALVVSAIVKKPWPVMFAGLTAASMLGVYEMALRGVDLWQE